MTLSPDTYKQPELILNNLKKDMTQFEKKEVYLSLLSNSNLSSKGLISILSKFDSIYKTSGNFSPSEFNNIITITSQNPIYQKIDKEKLTNTLIKLTKTYLNLNHTPINESEKVNSITKLYDSFCIISEKDILETINNFNGSYELQEAIISMTTKQEFGLLSVLNDLENHSNLKDVTTEFGKGVFKKIENELYKKTKTALNYLTLLNLNHQKNYTQEMIKHLFTIEELSEQKIFNLINKTNLDPLAKHEAYMTLIENNLIKNQEILEKTLNNILKNKMLLDGDLKKIMEFTERNFEHNLYVNSNIIKTIKKMGIKSLKQDFNLNTIRELGSFKLINVEDDLIDIIKKSSLPKEKRQNAYDILIKESFVKTEKGLIKLLKTKINKYYPQAFFDETDRKDQNKFFFQIPGIIFENNFYKKNKKLLSQNSSLKKLLTNSFEKYLKNLLSFNIKLYHYNAETLISDTEKITQEISKIKELFNGKTILNGHLQKINEWDFKSEIAYIPLELDIVKNVEDLEYLLTIVKNREKIETKDLAKILTGIEKSELYTSNSSFITKNRNIANLLESLLNKSNLVHKNKYSDLKIVKELLLEKPIKMNVSIMDKNKNSNGEEMSIQKYIDSKSISILNNYNIIRLLQAKGVELSETIIDGLNQPNFPLYEHQKGNQVISEKVSQLLTNIGFQEDKKNKNLHYSFDDVKFELQKIISPEIPIPQRVLNLEIHKFGGKKPMKISLTNYFEFLQDSKYSDNAGIFHTKNLSNLVKEMGGDITVPEKTTLLYNDKGQFNPNLKEFLLTNESISKGDEYISISNTDGIEIIKIPTTRNSTEGSEITSSQNKQIFPQTERREPRSQQTNKNSFQTPEKQRKTRREMLEA